MNSTTNEQKNDEQTLTEPNEKEASKIEHSEKEPNSNFKLEFFIAIMLGITAVLTAWASWIGSLHAGNQASNFTKSNNYSSTGNSKWNEASQQYMRDNMTWSTIYSLVLEAAEAELNNDVAKVINVQWQISQILNDSCSPEFQEAINWAFDNSDFSVDEGAIKYHTPFEMEGYVDSYFEEANQDLEKANELLEQGLLDNLHGDSFNLVTVVYSIVLFLLGIVGIFQKESSKKILLIIACGAFLFASIYMITIPLPTDFAITNFFKN